MSNPEKKSLEIEFRSFTSRNFEKPSRCRNIEQVQYYVRALCLKIEEFEKRFNYVPTAAYSLLAQYNEKQNKMIYRNQS